jgi:hypothetical protein
MYGGGYERFVPGIASADADAVNELIQSTSAPPMSTNFPFNDESVPSRHALLDELPPCPQRDELKDLFFEVFSPVCFFAVYTMFPLLPLYEAGVSQTRSTTVPGDMDSTLGFEILKE